jgi:F-type H+-transporting ATPase subunit b
MVTTMTDHPFYAHGVFWVAVAFVLFFAIFGGRLWKVVAATLDKRIAAIGQQLDEAARLRAEAEAMLADAEIRRQEAIEQAASLLAQARDEAARLGQTMAEEAAGNAARRERMALERIAAAEQAVVTDLRRAAIDLAAEAARSVLAETVSDDRDRPLIDHAIAQLPGALRAA